MKQQTVACCPLGGQR